MRAKCFHDCEFRRGIRHGREQDLHFVTFTSAGCQYDGTPVQLSSPHLHFLGLAGRSRIGLSIGTSGFSARGVCRWPGQEETLSKLGFGIQQSQGTSSLSACVQISGYLRFHQGGLTMSAEEVSWALRHARRELVPAGPALLLIEKHWNCSVAKPFIHIRRAVTPKSSQAKASRN